MKKTVSLGIRINEELAEMLDRIAKRSGLKPATIARMAIEEYLESVEKSGELVVKLADESEMGGASHEPPSATVIYKNKKAAG